ncbi:MAG: RNB domain-containing ribonuclease [Candidatus Saccharibacteria bacterium]
MTAVSPESLPLEELQKQAATEVAQFALPEDWDSDRTPRRADAFDKQGTVIRDDALMLSQNDEGSILHVSIADTGSFIPRMLPATTELAEQRGQTVSGLRPMLPYNLSRKHFGLVAYPARPAMTLHIPIDNDGSVVREPSVSREAVSVRAMSFEDFGVRASDANPDHEKYRDLFRLTQRLFLQRHDRDMSAYDEDDFMSSGSAMELGKFIVRECMIVAGASAALYMAEHDIPAIYLGNPFPRSSSEYLHQPRPNILNRQQMFMPFTSPLRCFPDFANHANLAAHLDRRPYPYPEEAITTMLPRLNRELRDITPRDRSFSPPKVRKLGVSAFKLLDKLSQDALQEGDLAAIFFGPLDATQSDKEHLREQALEYVKARPTLASAILPEAIERDWAYKQVTTGKNGRPTTHHFVVTDREGNRHDYDTRLKGATPDALTITMLGRVAGIELNPYEITEELRADARLQVALHDANKFMRTLDRKADIKYATYAEEDASSERFRGRAVVTIDGMQHYSEGYGASSKDAIQEASARLIQELDLVENPPAAQPHRK